MPQHFTVNRVNRASRVGSLLAKVAKRPIAPASEKTIAPLTESVVQRSILDLLAKHPTIAFSFRVNTAKGFLIDAKTFAGVLAGVIHYSKLKILARFIKFAFPGCSDIIGMLKGGRFFAIECKSGNGTLTDEQAAFLTLVNKYGGLGIVARSVDQVLKYLTLPDLMAGLKIV